MKITFQLFVCFLVYATISDVDQAESVGVSTECNNKTCLDQSLAIKSFNQVVVHKRSARKQSTHRNHLRKQPERKENKQIAEEVVRKIHKEALKKRKLATKLSKFRVRKLTEFALNSNKDIVRLVKYTNDEIKSYTEKAFAVQNITIKSAEITLELVRKTIIDLRKSLSEAAKTICELSKSYIGKFEEFSNTNMNEIITAVDESDNNKLTLLFTKSMAKIKDISVESGRCLNDTYNNAANIVYEIAKSGGVLVNGTAHKQIQKFESLRTNYENLEQYIEFVSGEIIDLSKSSADKYMELAKDCLDKLKQIVDKSVHSLKKYGTMLYDMAVTYIKNHSVSYEIAIKIIETVNTFHESSDQGLVLLLKYFKTQTLNTYTSYQGKLNVFTGCKLKAEGNCVVKES